MLGKSKAEESLKSKNKQKKHDKKLQTNNSLGSGPSYRCQISIQTKNSNKTEQVPAE